jgi:colanic acid/amylovoran biosynthesis glycosyltransferase
LKALRRLKPDVVLSEYGPISAHAAEACERMRIPLVAHFHGYDASLRSVIDKYQESYRQLFAVASRIVAVSKPMETRLLALGARPGSIRQNVYGVDVALFDGASPAQAPPVFVAVGRMVEKKAPHLTILAFAKIARRWPAARLRMIGEGPLLRVCKDLVRELDLTEPVTFLGAAAHRTVLAEMQAARAFVQHSVEAHDGDSEGTPIAILEAGACGLPVIATRHAGIPEVVVDGETGLLVDEGDVSGMAEHMGGSLRPPRIRRQSGTRGSGPCQVAVHVAAESYGTNGNPGGCRATRGFEPVSAGAASGSAVTPCFNGAAFLGVDEFASLLLRYASLIGSANHR